MLTNKQTNKHSHLSIIEYKLKAGLLKWYFSWSLRKCLYDTKMQDKYIITQNILTLKWPRGGS